MNILKRLRNLWRLSEYEPLLPNQKLAHGTQVGPIIKRPDSPATIVDNVDPLSIDLGN